MHLAAPLAGLAHADRHAPVRDAYVGAAREHDWCEALRRIALPRATPHRHAELRGDVTTVVSPRGVEFSLVAGSPQTLSGNCADQPAALWMVLMLDGRFLLECRRSDGAVMHEPATGDMLLGPTALDFTLTLPRDFRFLRVRIPHALLQARLVDLATLHVVPLPGAQGVNRVFAGMLHGVADTLDRLDAAQLRPVETALVEFAIASLQQGQATRPSQRPRAQQLQRICEAMEARLGDCELSLPRFAAEQRASPRYIQKLFGDADSSFSGHLRRRRLERCRADLASRAHEALSISEICFRWGFNDAAHFSRAFREQYGTTPRGFRQAALAAVTGQGAGT